MKKNVEKSSQFLGDFAFHKETFEGCDALFREFAAEEFKNLNESQKSDRVNRGLLDLIRKASSPAFLLIPLVDFIERINQGKILEHYTFGTFELWLNQFSGLTAAENYVVRAQIMGKWLPRDTYQIFFPIGMGKSYPGTHIVTAHGSPDLDTTVASFWGWVDAFAARVGDGLHVWNLPGGPPSSQVEINLLFENVFGPNVFNHLIKSRTTLGISSLDLLSQKGVVKKQTEESTQVIDHERTQNAVILVDEWGYYLGDWRNFDVEGVRQVIMLMNNTLRWFENYLHLKLVSLLAKENLTAQDFPTFVRSVFGMRINECEPVKEFSQKQKKYLQDYLQKVLHVSKGLESTFAELALSMNELSIFELQEFIDFMLSLERSSLFDPQGKLIENRASLFHILERIIKSLDKAIQSMRVFVERLEIALAIKREVFGYLPQSISYRADLEEIRSKMGNYPYLTVTHPEWDGRSVPMGVVHAYDVHKPLLGTVTLRDFCNREETKIPSYLEVISVIDHHRSVLNTVSPPVVYISDSQSVNVLIAELAFKVNDAFSTGGMTLQEIRAQIELVKKDLSTPEAKRLLQRLLQRELVVEKKGTFYVDPKREFLEYLHFLYAILDDTDLLTKVSYRDISCVASLLNRLKSLAEKKEVEVISFDDLSHDGDFVQKAAERILQNSEMYSLYRKIYLSKENVVEENLVACVKGESLAIFSDTKEQNSCCRVGQTKMFARNFDYFYKHEGAIRKQWYEDARKFYKEKNEVDLHLHMITTVAGAEDLFAGEADNYKHKDEIWIWIPRSEPAVEHLKTFLNAFRAAPHVVKNQMEVEFLGENAKELEQIFNESFGNVPRVSTQANKEALPIAVLYFKAGSINSRKAMITPYLPRPVS